MEQITNYVKPELIVVAIALYFVGMALKQAQAEIPSVILLWNTCTNNGAIPIFCCSIT